MAATMDPSQLRIAEKLIILNDRSIGMLTRMYNIKKACSDPNSKPKFLNDKTMEAATSIIVKKFPIVDLKKHSSAFVNVETMKQEITRNLSLYYYTFADLLDLKDHILQLLTTMDAQQCKLDITLNYDLTAGYLNLVVNYISLMILLSRVDDRKAVLGLFNAAYDFSHGHAEPSFPRLGQMIIDYENPIKKLAEDLGPLYRLINSALSSLREIYFRRNISAEQQREAQMLSLIANPKQILYAAQTNTIACEYLSLDVMDRWIILGVTVCHNTMLHDEALYSLYQKALQHGLSLRLFRDEYIMVYPMIQGFFETIKGYSKKITDIKELYLNTIQTCRSLHAHRRQFLRTALKELVLLIKDQPGLLGPKILFVWMGLSFARDEVLWLLRHIEIWPTIGIDKKKKDAHANTIGDKNIHELLFYMIELRELVVKHSRIVSRYHTEYIDGYDAIALDEMLLNVKNLPKDEYILISSCVDIASKVKTDPNVNLVAMRLDWFRFQAHISAAHSPFQLSSYRELAVMMNTMVFHSKMVDLIPEMIKETSDLSIYCFYKDQFDDHLRQCLNIAIQARYSISYAFISAQFVNSLHDMCPEEKDHIIERGLICCNMVLDEIIRRTATVLSQLTHEELVLAQKLSPEACGQLIAIAYANQNATLTKNHQPIDLKMPGYESIRTNLEEMTYMDKYTLYLTELCSAIGFAKEVMVSEHIFAPREYFTQHLERHLMLMIMNFMKPNDYDTPKRPSELFILLESVLNVLQTVNSVTSYDLTRFFQDMMLQQSQGLDCHGKETLASTYSRWYLEVLLRRASAHHIVYSDHLKAFIGINESSSLSFAPERYTDPHELRSLAQLIGPYGIKFIAERLTWHIASQITEMNKLVRENRDLLHQARINFDKPDKMRDITHHLSLSETKEKRMADKTSAAPLAGSPIDSILQRITIIGEIVAFRNLLFASLNDVIIQRLPFLMKSLTGLIEVSDELQKINISELSAAAGIPTEIDLALVNAIQAQAQTNKMTDPDEHYVTSCLLMVFIAISLPKLATMKPSFFKATYIASPNNCHVVPLGITTIGGALFFLHRKGDIPERMREFLALSSSVLLQLAGLPEKEKMPNSQSVYILIEQFVKHCSWLNYSLLESCFPYALIRTAYTNCYRQDDRSL